MFVNAEGISYLAVQFIVSMKEGAQNSKKIYYSMGEVAEMFDVNASLIRFWEQKFTILKPEKNKKGNRLFTPQDVENLKLIYHLVKENGMTLSGAQKRLKENREGIQRNLEIIESLQGIKTLLLEVRQELKPGPEDALEIRVDPAPVADPLPVAAAEPKIPEMQEPVVTAPEEILILEPEAEAEAEPVEETPRRMQIVEQTLF